MARQRSSGRPNDYDWTIARGSDLNRASGAIVQFEAFLSQSAETLMRLRGEVLMWLDSTNSAPGDVLAVAWGLIRAPSGSTDIGVSPLTTGGAPWVAYGIAHLAVEAAIGITAGDAYPSTGTVRFSLDSKAMRKFRENESLYMVLESIDVVGAPLFSTAFAIRALTAR